MRDGSTTWTTMLMVAALAVGCDDGGGTKAPLAGDDAGAPIADGATGGSVGGGAGGGTGGAVGGSGGGAGGATGGNLDAGPDPDIGVMDAGVDGAPVPDPDAAVDAAPPPLLDAGAACDPGDPEACGDQRSCFDGACRLDLQPTVYRMIDGEVLAPEAAAAALSGLLTLVVNDGRLNLLIEPDGYREDGRYALYIGNGDGDLDNDGEFDGSYVYRHNLPIQEVLGHWRRDLDGNPRFVQDGEGVFSLQIHVRAIEREGEDTIHCYTRVAATARIEMWPFLTDQGQERLMGEVLGYVTRADVESLEFELNGETIRFTEFLGGQPPDVDTNGDGEPDAYSFHLLVEAEPIVFTDENPERDPDPPERNQEACANP